MKKLLLAASIMALTSCSAPTEPQLNINPEPVLASQPVVKGKALAVDSRDLRPAQFVAVVDNGEKSVQPLHAKQNLRLVMQDALTRQFGAQGYTIDNQSQSKLRLDILEAMVNVKDGMMSHDLSSKLQIQLVVESPKGKFVKRYSGKSARSGAMSASVEKMEEAMNNLIGAVLKDIYADPELNTYLQENL